MSQGQTPSYLKGQVKQVLSGDCVIFFGKKPANGPPPERQVFFSNVIAPRLARRATSSQPETEDEPYAWEAREFLRRKLVGNNVLFSIDTKTPTGREYGTVFIGNVGNDTSNLKNVTEMMVSEGLLSVRRESMKGESTLLTLEDAAKAGGKGKWNTDASKHIRKVFWSQENMRAFVDKANGKPFPAVIEHVRDGSTVRCFLVGQNNDYYHVTLMISGIRCPMFKVDSDGKPDKSNAENFAEEARFYVEFRLLQRDVEIILESINNNNFVGSIKHAFGNIAETLLTNGYARCVDWSMASVTGGPEKLRAAEKSAKNNRYKLWANYKPSATSQMSRKEREVNGTVTEVVNGDSLMIKKSNGKIQKIFLASIRAPRLQDTDSQANKVTGKAFRQLYDVPYLFEAREFLRTKLIGQTVQAIVDYIQPPQNNFPEKTCCTVKIGGINVAEALISKGLATVVKYRQDDDQRSSCYDDLLSAEAKAAKDLKGIYNKKDIPTHRVSDISGDITKAKNFFPFLQRAGQVDALVEYVTSGSRLRLYIPKETCLVTFLLAGISCPKVARNIPGNQGGSIPGEPYGTEALTFTKEAIMQREVKIEVESMDKGGNYIGWLTFEGQKNLSISLVENGFSSMHVTAEGSKYYSELSVCESRAKSTKLNMWSNYVVKEITEKIEEVQLERKVDYKEMMISEVTREGHVYAQFCKDGNALITLMDSIREEFKARPPVAGAFTPRKGQMCAAKFVDNDWYRAKVERVQGKQVNIFYVDYGNRETTNVTRLATLPPQFVSQSFYAHELALALVKFPKDEDYIEDTITAMMEQVSDKEVKVNREYRFNNMDHYSMIRSDTNTDVCKHLLSIGLVMVDPKKDQRVQNLMKEYRAAQDEAKKKHLNMWQYGDVTEDDAFEFGMER